jgi:hypothetical protein
MDESKSLAVFEQRSVTPEIWQMINSMAPVMHESRLFGVSSKEQAAAIMLKGYEVGFGLAASFDLVQVIQGRPGVSPRGCMALILNSPKIKSVEVNRITDNKGSYVGHECTMERANGFKYSVRFTMEDAKRAGLVKPDSGWEKYPENMCQWRAIGFAADVVAPDITSGLTGLMKMPEQYGVALTAEGDIIDIKAEVREAAKPQPLPASNTEPELTLADLIFVYSADKIMAANGGAIPGTQEEVNAVAAKLAGGE